MANEQNLNRFRNYETLTDEERLRQREISQKGQKASIEKRKAKKTMQETFKAFCEMDIKREDAEKLIGNFSKYVGDDVLTIQGLITALALKIGVEDGNVKALEFIRDTSGNKPKDTSSVELSANVMTDADRRMMENVSKRITSDDVKTD